MLPDLSKTVFGSAALCTVKLSVHEDGSARRIQSDYRCQLRYGAAGADTDVRVYLVGQESATSGEYIPVVLAFLDGDEQQDRCRPGTQFELHEGARVTGTGTIHFVTGGYR